MKNSIIFLLILCLFSSIESKAQSSDTLQKILIMKKKSKRFIAKINTLEGVKVGLLYAADSAGITLLDSNYNIHFYAIEDIGSLKIKRVNPFGYAFNTMFHTGLGIGGTFATIFIVTGAYADAAGSLAMLAVVGIPIFFVGLGILTGVVFGAISSEVPFVNFKELKPDKYRQSLRYIKYKTQEYLVKTRKNARKLEIVY
jgi:hypothetical protein